MNRFLLLLATCVAATTLFGQSVSITFNVGTAGILGDVNGIFVAGGAAFGAPGDNPLTDADGDGIYTLTITRDAGFSSHYTFTNGACPDFGCKENIGGQSCADASNFNDRFLPPVMNDTIINTCFGECTTDTNCTPPSQSEVTFQLDMRGFAMPFTGTALIGNFNGWNGTANPLSDMDNDSIWTTTITLANGPIEFKYQVTGESGLVAEDDLSGDQSCAMAFGDQGQFVNRVATISGDVTLDAVCLSSCDACDADPGGGGGGDDMVSITFNVGTAGIVGDVNVIQLAGGGNFGVPGDFPMSDDDADGVYTITVMRPKGFNSFYTFANGPCSDFSCKENIAGQDCADPGNFNDRFLPAVMNDTIINTCFGQCTDDTNCAATMTSEVTFQLDLRTFAGGEYTGAALIGNFNGWNGTANPLSDMDNDSIWTTTIPLPNGPIEFKYQVTGPNGVVAEDNLSGDQSCAMAFGDQGQFVNRVDTISGDATLGPVCLNLCEPCRMDTGGGDDMVSITFNVGTSAIIGDVNVIQLAGGGNFGNPGDFPMSDMDGDGIYTITVMRPKGFSSFYTFTNGVCPDYGCKENIAGQACARPDNFNDRFLPAVMNDTIINTCFGQCTDNTMCMVTNTSEVTFQLDMRGFTTPFTSASLIGNFNGWDGNANPLSDMDNDSIWTATLTLADGPIEFKYLVFDVNGVVAEDTMSADQVCAMAFGDQGQFVNRVDTISADVMLGPVCLSSCEPCNDGAVSTNNELADYGVSFRLRPTVVNTMLTLDLVQPLDRTSSVQLIAPDGRLLNTFRLRGTTTEQFNVGHLPAGAYFMRLQYGNAVGVRRFIKR